jgi:hypothetical protein
MAAAMPNAKKLQKRILKMIGYSYVNMEVTIKNLINAPENWL